MLDKLKNIIETEDKKNPFTDRMLAVMLNISREKVIAMRMELGIQNFHERRVEVITMDAMKILRDDFQISERAFAASLQKLGYKISRYASAEIKKELSKEPKNISSNNNINYGLSHINTDSVEVFDNIVGFKSGLQVQINQAKAAILYPPSGLNTLITGPSGTGKSYLAENMYYFAKEMNILNSNAAFIVFNCADYADNPQLLLSQLFGYKKGAFSGAVTDKIGLVEKADHGILFLDEVHRLPSEGQEILFSILDKGEFRRLGSDIGKKIDVRIIAATSEDLESSLLLTFRRRIPMIIDMPPLIERSADERYALVKKFFRNEASQTGKTIKIDTKVIQFFMNYNCSGNVGQLLSDIRVACANSFLRSASYNKDDVIVQVRDIPKYEANLLIKEDQQKIYQPLIFDNSSQENRELIAKQNFKEVYSIIEDDVLQLRNNGVSEKEINEILQKKLNDTLKNYIGIEENLDKALMELSSIVDEKIIKAVQKAVYEAKKFIPELELRVGYFLSIHLSTLYERIEKGVYKKYIVDLKSIKNNYKMEYGIAQYITKKIENDLRITMPQEEIGMITMYLHTFSQKQDLTPHIKIIVISHGKVASAMADVVNHLLQTTSVIGIDMDFNESVDHMLEKVINIVEKTDEGKGCLLLADIGSLTSFGKLVTSKTGILTECVSYVNTAMVLEAVRRTALENITLDNLKKALSKETLSAQLLKQTKLKKALIFICMTGEGTAIQLIRYVKEHLVKAPSEYLEFFSIGALNAAKMLERINEINKNYDIKAIVGTANPMIEDILFISTQDVFSGNGMGKINKLFCKEMENYVSLKDIINKELILYNLECNDKTQVIDKLSRILLKNKKVVSEKYHLSIYKRESLGTTYLNGGIGIPHGDAAFVTKSAIAVAKLTHPILWENNFMVDLVFLFALKENDQKYIDAFYRISSDDNIVKNLREAKSLNVFANILWQIPDQP
ncbi:sigma 54-interacting transcriptional regulator [Pectinatus frisingensis]|uniref:sigma 54-interacting transcriptional regulator n=1 Tax=Pectinatus frisingensis TaxID=865 RepID=UPI003D807988